MPGIRGPVRHVPGIVLSAAALRQLVRLFLGGLPVGEGLRHRWVTRQAGAGGRAGAGAGKDVVARKSAGGGGRPGGAARRPAREEWLRGEGPDALARDVRRTVSYFPSHHWCGTGPGADVRPAAIRAAASVRWKPVPPHPTVIRLPLPGCSRTRPTALSAEPSTQADQGRVRLVAGTLRFCSRALTRSPADREIPHGPVGHPSALHVLWQVRNGPADTRHRAARSASRKVRACGEPHS